MSWYSSGFSILISAFSFSALSSNSRFNKQILGFLKNLGCYSNPAYEKVFLKATPSTTKDSVIDTETISVATTSIFIAYLLSVLGQESWKEWKTYRYWSYLLARLLRILSYKCYHLK